MRTLELKIPPTIVFLAIGVLMWGASRARPDLRLALPGLRLLAAALVVSGLAIEGWAIAGFRRSHTTFNPMRPERSATLVTSGIYRWTRNPMYLGLLFFLSAWALYLSSPLALLGVPALYAYLTRYQIMPEERALTARYGPEFTRYQGRVRRWM